MLLLITTPAWGICEIRVRNYKQMLYMYVPASELTVLARLFPVGQTARQRLKDSLQAGLCIEPLQFAVYLKILSFTAFQYIDVYALKSIQQKICRHGYIQPTRLIIHQLYCSAFFNGCAKHSSGLIGHTIHHNRLKYEINLIRTYREFPAAIQEHFNHETCFGQCGRAHT